MHLRHFVVHVSDRSFSYIAPKPPTPRQTRESDIIGFCIRKHRFNIKFPVSWFGHLLCKANSTSVPWFFYALSEYYRIQSTSSQRLHSADTFHCFLL